MPTNPGVASTCFCSKPIGHNMTYSCVCDTAGNWRSMGFNCSSQHVTQLPIDTVEKDKLIEMCSYSKVGKSLFVGMYIRVCLFLCKQMLCGNVIFFLLMCYVWVSELNINMPSALQWLNKAPPSFIHSSASLFSLKLDPSHHSHFGLLNIHMSSHENISITWEYSQELILHDTSQSNIHWCTHAEQTLF